MKKILVITLFAINMISVLGQMPPEEFFKGLDLFKSDSKKAKKEFLIAIEKDSSFHGSYHFLGVIYLYENKIDSAINCYKISISQNIENINNTREMTYNRLIDAYLYQHDFSNSFNTAWEAYQLYPENAVIEQNLKDVCLWSFYINHNELDSSYLSTELKDEYTVNSVPEEYLILRRIRIDDQPFSSHEQKLVKKRKVYYDVMTCNVYRSNKTVDVKFRLNWDLNSEFGGKTTNTYKIYASSELPVYERIGALLVSDSNINLKTEIEKILKD